MKIVYTILEDMKPLCTCASRDDAERIVNTFLALELLENEHAPSWNRSAMPTEFLIQETIVESTETTREYLDRVLVGRGTSLEQLEADVRELMKELLK